LEAFDQVVYLESVRVFIKARGRLGEIRLGFGGAMGRRGEVEGEGEEDGATY
jgi:hypothetical protein